jgi:hypothetical protein
MSRVTDGFGFPAVDLLMAIEVRQGEVGVAVPSSLCPWFKMMGLDLFVIEEGLPTHSADIALILGDLL